MAQDLTRGVVKKDSKLARQPISIGDVQVTGILDATTTQEVIKLSIIAEKVSIQADSTLAGNIDVSIDGKNWVLAPLAISASPAIATYSSNLITHVRVNRTGGSGKLTIAAK